MKKHTAFLFASLALNGAFIGYLALRPATSPTPAQPSPSVAPPTTRPSPGISDETKRLLADDGVSRLDELRDRLRAEGLPESIVRSVVEQRLWQARQAQLDAADPRKKRPWWQQTVNHLPGDDVRMARLEEKLRDEVLTKRAQLFPDAQPSTPDDSLAFLPAGKRQAAQRLRNDYEELQRRLSAESGDKYLTAADRRKLAFLWEEEQKDFRALLTSSEYAEMQLRTVQDEFNFKKAAALANLSEHQFKGLLAIREWRNQAEPKTVSTADPFAAPPPEIERKRQQILEEEHLKA